MQSPVGNKVIAILEVMAFAMTSAVLAFLTLLSVGSTAVFRQAADSARPDVLEERMDFHIGLPSWQFMLGLPALIIVISAGAWLFSRFGKNRRNFIVLAYVLLLKIVWISALSLTDYGYADSVMLSRGATYVLNGDMTAFAPGYCAPEQAPGYNPTCFASAQVDKGNLYNYFAWYPFQAGPLWWYVMVYAIFGTGNILAFQCINALAVTLTVALLLRFGTIMGLDRFGQTSLQLLIMLCVPLLMFAPFVYTNAVGLCLAIAAAWLMAEAIRSGTARKTVLLFAMSCLCAAMAIMVKSTFNILILALIIATAFAAIRLRKYWLAAIGIVCLAVAMKAAVIPTWALQKITGRDFGNGLPTMSWVAMGLQYHEGTLPGWWTNESLQMFRATEGDSAALQTYAIGSIKDSLSAFISDPLAALKFFAYKLASEWAEPSFGTAYYSTLGTRDPNAGGLIGSVALESGRAKLTSYNNVFQTMVYLLAFIAVISLCRYGKRLANREPITLFLAVGFLGGFLCYIFWEAKSIYTLPFYLLLLPLAAYGMQLTLGIISRGIDKCRIENPEIESTSDPWWHPAKKQCRHAGNGRQRQTD